MNGYGDIVSVIKNEDVNDIVSKNENANGNACVNWHGDGMQMVIIVAREWDLGWYGESEWDWE